MWSLRHVSVVFFYGTAMDWSSWRRQNQVTALSTRASQAQEDLPENPVAQELGRQRRGGSRWVFLLGTSSWYLSGLRKNIFICLYIYIMCLRFLEDLKVDLS